MTRSEKWEMFKNYLHNELEVSKEDIRDWIQDAIKEEARKMIKDTFGSNPVRDILQNEVKSVIIERSIFSDSTLAQGIKALAVQELVKELKIIPREKKDGV